MGLVTRLVPSGSKEIPEISTALGGIEEEHQQLVDLSLQPKGALLLAGGGLS